MSTGKKAGAEQGAAKTAETTAKDDHTVAKAAAPAGVEVPAAARATAEAGLAQVRNAYDTYRSLAEDATGALEDSFVRLNRGLGTFQAKALDAGRRNVDAGFDFAARMLSVRTLAEAVELQTQFARQQLDALSEQVKEFQELSARLQIDAAKPFSEGISKAAATLQRPL